MFTMANSRADERAEEREYQPLSTAWTAMRQELLREPALAHVLFMRRPLGRPFVHLRSANIGSRPPNMGATACWVMRWADSTILGSAPTLCGFSLPRWTP
ncbi:hypothetical protein SVIOM342S_04725 [Streptomyces violaceorubidus]